MDTSVRTDLSAVPEEVLALDSNASILWFIFLRKTGLATSAARKRKNIGENLWVDNESHRALIIRNFGIPSLLQGLPACRTELDRARVWWRESAACSEGDQIPDLGDDKTCLNPFIVTQSLKFKTADKTVDAVEEVVAKRGRPRKSAGAKQQSAAARQRRHRGLVLSRFNKTGSATRRSWNKA
jgi:hypothetical protein